MFIEQLRIGLKAPNDIFRRLNTVHAHNSLFAKGGENFFGCAFTCPASNDALFICNRNGNRVSSGLCAMTLPPNSSFFKIHNSSVKYSACSLQEVASIAFCLEANDVISYH